MKLLTEKDIKTWFYPVSKNKERVLNLKTFKIQSKNKIIKNTFR